MITVPIQLISKCNDKLTYFRVSHSPVARLTDGIIPVTWNFAFLFDVIDDPTVAQVKTNNNAVIPQKR